METNETNETKAAKPIWQAPSSESDSKQEGRDR